MILHFQQKKNMILHIRPQHSILYKPLTCYYKNMTFIAMIKMKHYGTIQIYQMKDQKVNHYSL